MELSDNMPPNSSFHRNLRIKPRKNGEFRRKSARCRLLNFVNDRFRAVNLDGRMSISGRPLPVIKQHQLCPFPSEKQPLDLIVFPE
jgi:hypothetical protein